jgi:hypothetical protein
MRYKSQVLLIFFQVSWYLTAQLIIIKKDLWSFIFPLISICLWLYFYKPGKEQSIKIFILGFLGLTWDFMLFKFDILKFPDGFPLGMISIWLLFSSVLDIYVRMFSTKKYAGALATGIFAPLSYLAAEKLTVLSIASKQAILYLFIFWFIYFLLSHYLLSLKAGKNYGT